MGNLKTTRKYYFTVEGETEKWYLEWLQEIINSTEESNYKVSIDCSVQKNPVKRAKSLNITSKVIIYHLSDYESNEDVHVKQFKETMDNLKKACELGKEITYKFGYSNFTFDLWIVLHKCNCNASLVHRSKYLSHINNAYSEHFDSMDEYKHERNFKRCLSKLNIDSVRTAIKKAKDIMQRNKENGYTLHSYKGYEYYQENPSLMIWEAIETIMKDCNLS